MTERSPLVSKRMRRISWLKGHQRDEGTSYSGSFSGWIMRLCEVSSQGHSGLGLEQIWDGLLLWGSLMVPQLPKGNPSFGHHWGVAEGGVGLHLPVQSGPPLTHPSWQPKGFPAWGGAIVPNPTSRWLGTHPGSLPGWSELVFGWNFPMF